MMNLSALICGVMLGAGLLAVGTISAASGWAVPTLDREATVLNSFPADLADSAELAAYSTPTEHHDEDGCVDSCCENIGVTGCCTLGVTSDAPMTVLSESSVPRALPSGHRRHGSLPDAIFEPPRLLG